MSDKNSNIKNKILKSTELYVNRIKELEEENIKLTSQLNLVKNYQYLKTDYDKLVEKHDELKKAYTESEKDLTELKTNYDNLQLFIDDHFKTMDSVLLKTSAKKSDTLVSNTPNNKTLEETLDRLERKYNDIKETSLKNTSILLNSNIIPTKSSQNIANTTESSKKPFINTSDATIKPLANTNDTTIKPFINTYDATIKPLENTTDSLLYGSIKKPQANYVTQKEYKFPANVSLDMTNVPKENKLKYPFHASKSYFDKIRKNRVTPRNTPKTQESDSDEELVMYHNELTELDIIKKLLCDELIISRSPKK